eukprot:gnl/MRDRNA2_/MRDRNA2_71299_c0_seq1.p1 gnl/MRDRNA2_/MRDRNA2_71299_c0~~gnl/MRDRNA2_/MRDRNA2_71299_c0_seq1.p1  ORF type:complete len:315 (-),score=49.56 gnl/MRDRNA2_/MRDRNA2_71299_c0_seq1:76-1020(-)
MTVRETPSDGFTADSPKAKTARLQEKTVKAPIIDIAPFFADGSDDATKDRIAQDVASACETVGFFIVVGHGIPMECLDNCSREARKFFGQAPHIKEKVAANGRAYGFFPFNTEALGYDADVSKRPDLREAFSMGPQHSPAPGMPTDDTVVKFCYQETPWPEGCELREAMSRHYKEATALAEKLLRIFARSLKVEASFFLDKCRHHASSSRVIHYPALSIEPQPGQLRCGDHNDICTITILWQDVDGGLEIRPRGQEEWVPVKCPREGFVLNDASENIAHGAMRFYILHPMKRSLIWAICLRDGQTIVGDPLLIV